MNLRFVFLCLSIVLSTTAQAQVDRSPAGEARWLLERLTGVKWSLSDPVTQQMIQKITAGDRQGAVDLATSQPQFLNVLVKQMAVKMSNRDETIRDQMNDFAASFMGVTRDQRDARELLFGDFYYAATDMAAIDPANPGVCTATNPNNNQQNYKLCSDADLIRNVIGSNNHYATLESMNVDIGAALRRVSGQKIAGVSTTTIIGTGGQTQEISEAGVPVGSPDPAGVLTSRAWMQAHAVAGTNRRLVEYTFREFMCVPIQEWADTLGSDIRVGRDVDRQPGGDPTKFLTTCKGCHSVMDGFRGAFAKYDWGDGINEINNGNAILHMHNGATNGDLRPRNDQVDNNNRTASGVVYKMNRNDFVQFAGGYVSRDDSFVNNANRGANATLFGWRGPAPYPAGESPGALANRTAGVHAFGRLVAGSKRFSTCMAKRVWEAVCHTEYSTAENEAIYSSLGLDFEGKTYNLKALFQTVALHPKCRR
ncbi:MAG: hypothetical protein AB7F86_03715 [Bdellovibrionales bacterium]